MGVRAIVTDAEELSKPCKEVEDINTVQDVIKNLIDTAKYHQDISGCVGLAANQIGYDVRVFVVKIRGKFLHFVNPSFKAPGNMPMVTFNEHCLSFPGKATKKKRHAQITVSGYKKKKLALVGLQAIAFQHELDHLNGICI
jgi:peptide deformylase